MTVTPDLLRKLLRYDPETGALFWLERSEEISPDWKRWNSRLAGKEAFTAVSGGYRHGIVFKQPMKAHRVIWAIVHGEWPDQIDHINGDKADNRIVNLRSVSVAENLKNKRPNANNTSGITGVFWRGDRKKWVAQINVRGRQKTLGYFVFVREAVRARKLAEQDFGYHPNHGIPA